MGIIDHREHREHGEEFRPKTGEWAGVGGFVVRSLLGVCWGWGGIRNGKGWDTGMDTQIPVITMAAESSKTRCLACRGGKGSYSEEDLCHTKIDA
jgi:hypothetical protein